LQKFNSSE